METIQQDEPLTKTSVCYFLSCVLCCLCISPRSSSVYRMGGQWNCSYDGELWMPSCLRWLSSIFSVNQWIAVSSHLTWWYLVWLDIYFHSAKSTKCNSIWTISGYLVYAQATRVYFKG